MLILISLLPAVFAMNPQIDVKSLRADVNHVESVFANVDETKLAPEDRVTFGEARDHV